MKQSSDPTNRNRIRGGLVRTSWQETAKSISTKGPVRKSGGCAVKVVRTYPGRSASLSTGVDWGDVSRSRRRSQQRA